MKEGFALLIASIVGLTYGIYIIIYLATLSHINSISNNDFVLVTLYVIFVVPSIIFCLVGYKKRQKRFVMKKIKEFNFFAKNEDMVIRSIKHSDLTFYKEWYKKELKEFHKENTFKYDFIYRSENDIEVSMYIVKGLNHIHKKLQQILIIELNGKPIGEINVGHDRVLIIKNKEIKKPYYNMWIKMHEKYTDYDMDNLIKMFIKSISNFKIKIGALYTFVDENSKQNLEKNYFENGFEDINRNYDYPSGMKKRWKKWGFGNTLFRCKILIKTTVHQKIIFPL
jgi:hypothetical protein